MIYGIGTDIVQVARIETALARHGERFAEKILGSEELTIFRQRSQQVAARGILFLASRFAAKEAFSKAIGLGMQLPMSWHAMQTLNEASGRPVVATNDLLKRFMLENGLSAQVSITDEADYAVAFVIVEKN